jgi:hypothetical protein
MSALARAPAVDREAAPARKAPATRGASSLLLQRKCACGAGAGAGGTCEPCTAAAALLQRHSTAPAADHAPDAWPTSVHDTLARSGQPLDADTRHFMEDSFDADFSGVRVHDDTAAADSARAVDAQAYTVGQHIVFGDSHYQPHSTSGRHLLAHELAHTVQQQGLQRNGLSNLADHGPDYRQLEAQADHAADRVMGGQPLGATALSRSGPRLSRKPAPKVAPKSKDDKDQQPGFKAAYDTTTYNRSFTLTGTAVPEQLTGTVDKNEAAYKVDTLVLPPQKGATAVQHCSKNLGTLGAVFDWSSGPVPTKNKAGKNEARDPTETLQRAWLATLGYKLGRDAHTRWSTVGGEKQFPKPPLGPTCEMDHVQELQVGGTNAGENLQVIDKVDNASSGGLIQQQLRQLAEAAFNDAQEVLDGKRPKRVSLSFGGVVMQGAPVCGTCCQLAQRFVDPTITAASEKPTVNVDVSIKGQTFTLKLPADKSKSIPLTGANAGIATSIKGLTLVSYERGPKGKGHDSIRATLDAQAIGAEPDSKSTLFTLRIGADGTLQAPKGRLPEPIKAQFPKLSPVTFTTLTVDDAGTTATGTLKPSLPLLPVLDVVLDPQGFRVGKALDPAKIKPPFPGVKVTEASIMMELAPAFKPVGTLSFAFGGAKKVADLKLAASADDAGLVLRGDLLVYIPGVDQAKGQVTYQAGQWSGGAHIEASQLKMPFVQGGAMEVGLKGGKLDAAGKVHLELPGKNPADLSVKYQNNEFTFSGSGRITTKSKYLKPIDVSIYVRGNHFRATGKAGIAFSGLDGTVDATYDYQGGRESVYGKGKITIDKGRAKGSIDVELHPNETLTGTGNLSYEIKKGMVGTANITIDDKQKITFVGALAFTDIPLFDRFPKDPTPKNIFTASGSVPIPGASIGSFGLKFRLSGGLGYSYYIGPGKLTSVVATVKFSPFEPDPDFAFTLKAQASIPAYFGIEGKVKGEVVLDAYIAEAGAGLSVEAYAGLQANVGLDGEIKYSRDHFTVDSSAYVGGSIVLGAGLFIVAHAEAGVWRLKTRTEKKWKLTGGTFDTGLKQGVRIPLYYDSATGFRLPSLSDIKREPAEFNLDTKKMLGNLFAAAREE